MDFATSKIFTCQFQNTLLRNHLVSFNPNKSFVELKMCEFSVHSTYIKSKKKCEKKKSEKSEQTFTCKSHIRCFGYTRKFMHNPSIYCKSACPDSNFETIPNIREQLNTIPIHTFIDHVNVLVQMKTVVTNTQSSTPPLYTLTHTQTHTQKKI